MKVSAFINLESMLQIKYEINTQYIFQTINAFNNE